MTIRLYFDEDSMDRNLVRALRARGVDVQTALEAGMIRRKDRDQLVYAASQQRVLYTFNAADFSRLHSEFLEAGQVHAGIVVARQQHYTVGQQMRRLLKLIAQTTAEQMRNELGFLSHWD